MAEKNNLLFIVLIAALLVTVGLQTVQLAALSSSGGIVIKSSPSAPIAKTGGVSGAVSAGSLQNLPSMVGGC